MFIDIMDYTWKDRQTGRLTQIVELEIQLLEDEYEQEDEVVLIWYKDLGTSEVHCMTENMFTLKHDACGSMIPLHSDA